MQIKINRYQLSYLIVLGIFTILFISSCKKQDNWLNVKSNKSDVTPKTLQDFQSILDNSQVMNSYGSILGLVGTDNIFIPDNNLDADEQTSRNTYLWAKDIYQGSIASDWYYAYQEIEYANIILDGLGNINEGNQADVYNNIKGSALFYRAFALYQLSQLYCKQYDPKSSISDLGLPLRVSSDVNTKYVRSSVKDTYTQIINDLNAAEKLLPKIPLFKTRPSTTATDALLAKVYLSMSDYSNCALFVNKALIGNSKLLDFSSLNIKATNPFPTFAKGNPEVIYHAATYGLSTVWGSSSVKARVDPQLFKSYETGDLRINAFYLADGTTGLFKFKGSYTGNAYNFCGLATNELYLIRAECSARAGSLTEALGDLNTLLQNRYSKSTYLPFRTSEKSVLLAKILLERRKEMPYNGNSRWEDLKRLNAEGQFLLTLNRTYHGISYSLDANDPKYILPLPEDEIQINHLPQNSR